MPESRSKIFIQAAAEESYYLRILCKFTGSTNAYESNTSANPSGNGVCVGRYHKGDEGDQNVTRIYMGRPAIVACTTQDINRNSTCYNVIGATISTTSLQEECSNGDWSAIYFQGHNRIIKSYNHHGDENEGFSLQSCLLSVRDGNGHAITFSNYRESESNVAADSNEHEFLAHSPENNRFGLWSGFWHHGDENGATRYYWTDFVTPNMVSLSSLGLSRGSVYIL